MRTDRKQSALMSWSTLLPALCLDFRSVLKRGLWLLLPMIFPLVLVACGGADDTPSPGISTPKVTSITASPSGVSIGGGQTQTVQAEARDQNGSGMAGVVFTWASSNSAVAVVADGVATGLAAGTTAITAITAITASSGGVTSNAASLSVNQIAMGSVLIDKPSVFLPGRGQAAQLPAQVLDPQGAPSSGRVTWTSSAPDKVSVDATGRLVALAIGSAQVFAQSAGVRSAPTLVIVAQPQAGALLVTDAQVAGKVVATRQEPAGLVVTLALAPLYQLFSDCDIRFDIDFSAFAFEAVPDRAAVQALSTLWSGIRP